MAQQTEDVGIDVKKHGRVLFSIHEYRHLDGKMEVSYYDLKELKRKVIGWCFDGKSYDANEKDEPKNVILEEENPYFVYLDYMKKIKEQERNEQLTGFWSPAK